MLTGERPGGQPRGRRAASRRGATTTSSPTSSGHASGRSSAGSCRTRTSASSSREDLARLREVTASQGLMLESVSERLMETVHAGSPTKHPARAAEDDRGGRRASDPVHERDPGRDRRDRGGADRLARGPGGGQRPPRPPPGGDPAELRPAPELLRARGRRDRRRSGRAARWRARGAVGTRPGRWRRAARLGDADNPRRHEAPGSRVPPADARGRHPGSAEPLRTGGTSWWPRAPPISAGCPPTATTSLPSSRSRARIRCGRGFSRRATR